MEGLRPILVVALTIGVAVGVPTVVDLCHFLAREWEYYKFKRLFRGEHDQFLRADWDPDQVHELHGRLVSLRQR